MERRPERISSLNVERGLYVVRYVSSSASDNPVIFVRSSPGDEGVISVIPFPGDAPGRLTTVGSLLVISAMQGATLQVTAQAVSPTGSLNAELQVEPLKPGAAAADAPAVRDVRAVAPKAVPELAPVAAKGVEAVRQAAFESAARPAPAPEPAARPAGDGSAGATGGAGSEQIKILAHVSRRGDVVVSEGEWVAGPDAPAPVEGLAVKFPAGLGDFQYQVLASGESRWSDWLSSGAFGGSRGKAKTLVGVRLRLVPATGINVSMEGEALFLGSAVVRKDGLEMEFRSAAGFDPLLGLRLEVKRDFATRQPMQNAVPEVPPVGRVRVFRASGRRSG